MSSSPPATPCAWSLIWLYLLCFMPPPPPTHKGHVPRLFLPAVLLGPLRAVSYLLLHGLVAATLGTLWKGGVGWWTSIAISSVVRMVGQLSYLVLRCGRGQGGRGRDGCCHTCSYLVLRCGQGAGLVLLHLHVPLTEYPLADWLLSLIIGSRQIPALEMNSQYFYPQHPPPLAAIAAPSP